MTPNKRDTAMVFQSYALFPHYTVIDNRAYNLKLTGGEGKFSCVVFGSLIIALLNTMFNYSYNINT